MFQFRKPLLPSHYFVWFEPPDESGDEVLRVVSHRRSFTLKGHSFRDFYRCVAPLLDGKHTMEEICAASADVFDPKDLDAALRVLGAQKIVIEGEMPTELLDRNDESVSIRLTPQLNYLHETTEEGRKLQSRLTNAKVAVVGLGGAGAAAALGLAAAGIGELILVDAQPLISADIYFSPFFGAEEIGGNRAKCVAARIKSCAPQVRATAVSDRIDSEEELWQAIKGSDYVVCCLNAGMLNLTYKLNRLCIANGLRWIFSALEGAEVVVGPAFDPISGPCFMCYRMRAVACAGNPNAAFALEEFLDRKKADFRDRGDNLVFGAGIVANMLGVEVLNEMIGSSESSLVGRLLTIDLRDLTMRKHTVLKKPWCPACGQQERL